MLVGLSNLLLVRVSVLLFLIVSNLQFVWLSNLLLHRGQSTSTRRPAAPLHQRCSGNRASCGAWRGAARSISSLNPAIGIKIFSFRWESSRLKQRHSEEDCNQLKLEALNKIDPRVGNLCISAKFSCALVQIYIDDMTESWIHFKSQERILGTTMITIIQIFEWNK